jgi:hypothetical protein
MATVLGTAAGAVFVYGLERWAELRGLQVIQDAERQRLEQLLGVDRGVFAELQSGLVILGPLLASAAAAFLPG